MSQHREKVTHPLDAAQRNNGGSVPTTAGALALTPHGDADANAAAEAARLAADAQAWGLTIPSDFTPATKAQVAYWRELCGAISLQGKAGMRDGSWPVELSPSKPTLQDMAERRLIVRRGGAWHLKRKWYAWLQYLRLTAVATPPLTVADRPAPHLPTFADLKQYEAVSRWLEGQSRCRTRLPMDDVPEVGVVAPSLLQAMRRHKLVRHTSDCSWVLSSKWRAILLALWQGRTKVEGEQTPHASAEPMPYSVAAGLDTLYVNRIDPDGLPAALCVQLEDLQELARDNDEEVDTPWRYDGVPLRMYRSGANTKQGGGVTWSYILRNPSLTVLIRKTPLGGIVAQARLGSECLWRLTPLRALDELDALVGRMWRGSQRYPRKQRGSDMARWQVSQAHLCHDVANAPISLEQLDRYVSRSRQQAVYAAAQADLRTLYAVVDGRTNGRAAEGEDELFDPAMEFSFDLADELGWEDPFAFVDEENLFTDDALAPQRLEVNEESVEESVEERALQLHCWGKRLSGVSWSVRGDLAFVQYDKTLESRLRHKRFMEPIWRANGWDGNASVTRHEARWRRPAFRAFRASADRSAAEESVDPDDPWVFVRRLAVYWGYTVGSAPPAQDGPQEGQERYAQEMHGDDACHTAASAVDVAWIRRVTPVEGDRNRSRWPTDPTWQVVQAASFADADPSARRLMRRQQRLGAVQQLDAGAYGYLVSRTAQLHPEGERWDVSWAARELVEAFSRIAETPDKDFGQLVRQRRRQRGLPVTPAPAILPDLPLPPAGQEAHDLRALDAAAEMTLQDKALSDELHMARLRLAERRLAEAFVALEETERRASGDAARRSCEDAYERALASYAQLHSAAVVSDHSTPPDSVRT